MSDLYIITGPAGVGKSTISKKIANNKEKSALIEGDKIYHQVVGGYVSAWKPENHLEIFWEICFDMINTYLENGYDVIFNYIVNPENLKMIKNKFTHCKIKFIILIANEKEILKRDALRPENCQMKKRCIELLENFKRKNFTAKFYLDTSNLTIEETVQTIENNDEYWV